MASMYWDTSALDGLEHFAESLAVGILRNETWVEGHAPHRPGEPLPRRMGRWERDLCPACSWVGEHHPEAGLTRQHPLESVGGFRHRVCLDQWTHTAEGGEPQCVLGVS